MNDNKKRVKQQLSEEELQRTQVLNFDDFKATTRIEKIGSKKPAVIVATIGLIAIILGATYPGIQSLISNNKKEQPQVQTRKEDNIKKSKLNCTKTKNNPDGTVEKITINYEFENDKLKSFEKIFELTIAPGAINGQSALQTFKTTLPSYLTQKNGYDIATKEIENGIEVITKVDYNKLNINELPQSNQADYRFNVTYIKDATKDSVLKDMQKEEFSCL